MDYTTLESVTIHLKAEIAGSHKKEGNSKPGKALQEYPCTPPLGTIWINTTKKAAISLQSSMV